MDFLRRSWAQVGVSLSGLSANTRMVLIMSLVVLVMFGWIVLQYVGEPEWVPLSQVSTDRVIEAGARLSGSDIKTRTTGGRIDVRKEDLQRALAVLAEGELLAADTSQAFDDMVEKITIWHSNDRTKQAMMLARQRVLSGVIMKMRGVRGADVVIGNPENPGFGTRYVRPTASVSLVMEGARVVDKRLVEAIAGLVSGSVAEMRPQDVTVIDANRGVPFTVASEDQALPGDHLEMVEKVEQRYYEKINGMLRGYIPGVIVAVNVVTDNVARQEIKGYTYAPSESVKQEYSRTSERSEASNSGEPGPRSNTGLAIAGGGALGSSQKEEETRTEFDGKPLTEEKYEKRFGGQTKQVNVTVNVPRSYFVALFLQGKPADTPAPDDAALVPVVTAQLAQIEAQVKPLVSAEEAGVVKAHMIPDAAQILAMTTGNTGNASAGMGALVHAEWMKTGSLAALALGSLAMMFYMVRRSTQVQRMPSIEELAGIPPTLPGDEELVGEAEQSDPGMAGVELDEGEVRTRKIAQQISDMVKANPTEAANLFNKWVRTDE